MDSILPHDSYDYSNGVFKKGKMVKIPKQIWFKEQELEFQAPKFSILMTHPTKMSVKWGEGGTTICCDLTKI